MQKIASTLAALSLATSSLPAREGISELDNARQAVLEERAARNEDKLFGRTVRELAESNPIKAAQQILASADNPELVKVIQASLRTESRLALQKIDNEQLAALVYKDDPAKQKDPQAIVEARKEFEKLIYPERVLTAAAQVRKLIDEALKPDAVVPADIFGRIRAASGNMKLELPALLTGNGSFASQDGFLADVRKLMEKFPADHPKHELADKGFIALLKDFAPALKAM